jgi:hypothetical protein
MAAEPSNGTVAFVLLNPSTADAERDDPTVRRCLKYARDWGYARLEIGNVFAWRATDPKALLGAAVRGQDIVGPENDAALERVAREASLIVCGWSRLRDRWHRARRVAAILQASGKPLHVLRLTKRGEPAHPLRLPGALRPIPWAGYPEPGDPCAGA